MVGFMFIAACSSDKGTMSAPDGAAGAGGIDSGSGAADSAVAVVTYQDVKPIFATKCVPCHLPGGQGAEFHTLADSYETANKPAGTCPGKKVGECTLELVKSGFMPFGKGCTGDPAKDTANAACLTAAEQQKLADWIAGGLLEK
jgi:hypothetical protein